MVTKKKKYAIITLNDDSFKQFLLNMYGEKIEIDGLNNSIGTNQESVLNQLWNELFKLADHAIQKNGGSIMGFELVDGQFEKCEKDTLDYSSQKYMWVIRLRSSIAL